MSDISYRNLVLPCMTYNEVLNESDDGQPEWIPLRNRDRLRMSRVLSIGTVSLIPVFAKLTIFLVTFPMLRKLEVSRLHSGLIWLVYPAVILLVNPVVMSMSDVTRSPIGRRRPYIIGGTILILASLIVIFFIDHCDLFSLSLPIRRWFFIGCFTIICVGIQLIEYPSQQLIRDLIPQMQYDQAQQAIQMVANLIFLVWCLLVFLRVHTYAPKSFRLTDKSFFVLLSTILIFICFLFSMVAGREEQLTEAPLSSNPFQQMVEAAKSGRPTKLSIAIFFILSCGTIPFYVSLSHYVSATYYEYDSDRAISFSLGMWAISFALNAIVTIIPMRTLAESTGIRRICAVAVFIITFILCLFFWVHNKWAMLGCLPFVDVLYKVVVMAHSDIELNAATSDMITGCRCLLDSVMGLGVFLGVLIYEIVFVKLTDNIGKCIGFGAIPIFITFLVYLAINPKKETLLNLERTCL